MAPARRRKNRKRLRSKSAPAVLRSPIKRGKRKQWSDEAMIAALEAVKNGSSIKRAALEHGVPRTTLSDRHLGKVVHGTRPGPKCYLSRDEETELGAFIQVVGKLGYGKTRKQVKNIAESVARDKGVLKSKRISDGWFRRFLERQSHLCLRKGDPTANVRMDAMANKEALDNYFKLLKEVMEENDLMDKPGQIYNVDESGMPLDHRPPRVLTTKREKKVRYRTSGNKSQITVIGCVNAAGQTIPPLFANLRRDLNTLTSDEEIFEKWYEEGCDIYDNPNYVSWLMENHPEAVPVEFFEDGSHCKDDDPLPHEDHGVSDSLADFFSDISPCEPLTADSQDNATHVSTLAPETGSVVATCTSLSLAPSSATATRASESLFSDTATDVSASVSTSDSTSVPTSTEDPISTYPGEKTASSDSSSSASPPEGSSTPSISNSAPTDPTSMIASSTPSTSSSTPMDLFSLSSSSGSSRSSSSKSKTTPLSSDVISKYLVQYVPATPKSRKTDAQRVTGARVLTSAQGLAILKEKEDKKKKETEEKEKRKQERVDKKKQREELAKKKAEERAKKAQEKNSCSQRKPAKRKSTSQPKGVKLSKSSTSTSSTSSTSTSTTVSPGEPPVSSGEPSVSPGEPSSNSTDTECCECSRTYNEDVRQGTGVEWVQCGCGRWLHEECIDSVIQDADGQERFCSFCVV